MRHVIVICNNTEESEKLRLLTIDSDTSYIVVNSYNRSEWPRWRRDSTPHSAKIIGCKTEADEFLLHLKFNTLSNPNTSYGNEL